MNALFERLYLELRQSEQEIKESLQNGQEKEWLKSILEDELADIASTISKLEKGKFGQCEISGELIPDKILKTIPTLKSINDFRSMDSFYRKPIDSRS